MSPTTATGVPTGTGFRSNWFIVEMMMAMDSSGKKLPSCRITRNLSMKEKSSVFGTKTQNLIMAGTLPVGRRLRAAEQVGHSIILPLLDQLPPTRWKNLWSAAVTPATTRFPCPPQSLAQYAPIRPVGPFTTPFQSDSIHSPMVAGTGQESRNGYYQNKQLKTTSQRLLVATKTSVIQLRAKNGTPKSLFAGMFTPRRGASVQPVQTRESTPARTSESQTTQGRRRTAPFPW